MELERNFFLNFPYNCEYDHLPASSSRLMRNLAEKMRRDKLNMYISELSSLVPIVAMATKRMDKTSVLRLSANFLRIHLSLKQNRKRSKVLPPEGLEANLSNALLESMEGFMLIVTASGKIVYVSDSVEKLLGHSQLDLMGQSMYTITHNGDHDLLRHHLAPPAEADEKDVPDFEVPRSPSFFGGNPEDTLSGLAAGKRRSFYVRLAERSMARGDPARHVTVHMIGMLKPATKDKKDAAKASSTKAKKDLAVTGGDEPMLICVARPIRNKVITELSLMEAIQDEYVTRHLPDGRIIYSDHRIAFVAGYMTEEVMGLSAFHFIHQDDLPWATVANRQMFSSVEGQGYSVYRLKSKTGSLIHLKTKGYLEFNKTTQKVETFVCVNTLLEPDEGDKELEKERDRITPFITFQQVTTTTTSTNASLAALPAPPATATSKTASPAVSSPELVSNSLTSPAATETASSAMDAASGNLLGENLMVVPKLSPSSNTIHIVEYEGCDDDFGTIDTMAGACSTNQTEMGEDMLQTAEELVTSLSPPELANIFMGDPDVISTVGTEQKTVVQHNTSFLTGITTNGKNVLITNGQDLPRLKRPLSEVDDIVLTPSAKRAMVPTAFISSFSTIHHVSPHMSNKWTTEKASTILFDQHNNNG